MSKFQYVTVDTILAKYYRDLRGIDVNETDAIEWIGEALNFIKTPSVLEEHIAFVEVKDYQCDIPKNLAFIIQLAKNNIETKICKSDLDSSLSNVISNGGENEENLVPVDCQGKIIGDYEVGYYRPYYDLKYEYGLWGSSIYKAENYSPIRLSNHTFFNTLVCREDEDQIYKNCDTLEEYTIVHNQLRFSFKEGLIAIAYLKYPTDENGYPLIPDDSSCTTAITYYMAWKIFEREFWLNKANSDAKATKAEQRWLKYCLQFKNSSMMPKGVDDYQDLMEQSRYLIPRLNRYYGFFGNLGKKEKRPFNNPDNRTKRFTYYR